MSRAVETPDQILDRATAVVTEALAKAAVSGIPPVVMLTALLFAGVRYAVEAKIPFDGIVQALRERYEVEKTLGRPDAH